MFEFNIKVLEAVEQALFLSNPSMSRIGFLLFLVAVAWPELSSLSGCLLSTTEFDCQGGFFFFDF